MATALHFGCRSKQVGARLDPALKEFLDRVIVPILVKEYLVVAGLETEACGEDRDEADFAKLDSLRAVRP